MESQFTPNLSGLSIQYEMEANSISSPDTLGGFVAQNLLILGIIVNLPLREEKLMKRGSELRRGYSGFTMLELMITCAIIVILSTISIAGFSSWLPSYRLKSAARELYSNMQQVKMAAIKQQANSIISYSIAPHQYQYSLSGVSKTVVLSDYGSGVKFAGPSDFATPTPPYDQAVITFNSRGMCTGSAGYAYLSNDEQSAHYRVGVVSTGGIKLERWSDADSLWKD